MGLPQSFLDTVEKYRMLCPGDKVVVGVSGGPDSVALLDLLIREKRSFGISVHVAHLNHMIRGEEADADEEFVRQLVRSRGLNVTIGRENVPKLARTGGLSLEDAARAARYRFFEVVALSIGANKVAVAHTLDDQAETVLMRLIRGAGLDGLSGIPPVRCTTVLVRSAGSVAGAGSGRTVGIETEQAAKAAKAAVWELTIVRPLIETSKAEVEEYCRLRGLAARLDSTNLDPSYFRNSVRMNLLPVLAEYNPDIKHALARAAELLRDDREVLEALAAAKAGEISTYKEDKGSISVSLGGFAGLPKGLQRRVLRQTLSRAGAPLERLGFVQMENILSFVTHGKSRAKMRIPGGIRAYKGSTAVTFSAAAPAAGAPDEVSDALDRAAANPSVAPCLPGGATGAIHEVELKIPGVTTIPWTGQAIRARLTPIEGTDFWSQPAVATENEKDLLGRVVAYFDYDEVSGRVVARSKRPGDRFWPFGMKGTKKVKDFLIASKVPVEERDRLVVVACDDPRKAKTGEGGAGKIMWLLGYRTDERFRVTEETRTILRLEVVE